MTTASLPPSQSARAFRGVTRNTPSGSADVRTAWMSSRTMELFLTVIFLAYCVSLGHEVSVVCQLAPKLGYLVWNLTTTCEIHM